MKPQEKLTAPPLSHYCRSKEGLWVKAERDPLGIHVYWQVRSDTVGGWFMEYDAQGEVMSRVPITAAVYSDPWKLAGTIEPSNAIVEVAGLQDFDWFQFGMMRHAAELIALGWGDDPEDVMSWFDDPSEGFWIREGEYKLVGPARMPFVGLDFAKLVLDDRMTASEEEQAKRLLTGTVIVGDSDEFPFEFPLAEVLAPITISAIPV